MANDEVGKACELDRVMGRGASASMVPGLKLALINLDELGRGRCDVAGSTPNRPRTAP